MLSYRKLSLSPDPLSTKTKESLAHDMAFTTNLEEIADCNVYVLTAPTPIDSSNRLDLTPLIKSSESVYV